jgi:anaerobic magnesium-protoporphyrin IX monomethyl ester cyclase
MKNDLVLFFYSKTEPNNIYRNLPISILKLASQVQANGYRFKFIDSRLDSNYISSVKQSVKDMLCLCISCMTGYQIYQNIKVSKVVKSENPEIPVIWGGWHPSLLPDETIKNEYIDIIVKKQGEKSLIEVLNALVNNSSFNSISGISFKENGLVIHNPERKFENIKNYVPINFDILDIKKYINKSYLGERTIFWNASQGCSYNCGFCCTPTVYKGNWSAQEVKVTLDEIETLVKRYGVDSILFAEDNFFIDKRRVKSICEEIIEKKLNIKWATDSRIDQIIRYSDNELKLLKKSGCIKLYLGAESGDQEVLNLVDKRIKVEDILKAAKMLHKNEIIGEFFIMVGFPLNPEKDLKMSVELITRIKREYPNHQATSFLYTPYPGTRLLDIAKEKGAKLPNTLDEWVDWSMLGKSVPWIKKDYFDRANRIFKFYLPFAYPSASLLAIMNTNWKGLFYKLMHKIAKLRIENNIHYFPLEWYFVKFIYYRVGMKFNIFKNLPVPR